jgi:hypothetical protein
MRVVTQTHVSGFNDYVENALWTEKNVVFSTIHVVGSNNNLSPWSGIDNHDSFVNPRKDRLEEFQNRLAAALYWLETTFAVAGELNSPGVFITIHANPQFNVSPSEPGRAGFNDFLDALEAAVIDFGRPVILAHGDSHYFRIDKPLLGPTLTESGIDGPRRRLEHFTRVETFGTNDVHWLEVTVRPNDPNVFLVEQRIVDVNRFKRP